MPTMINMACNNSLINRLCFRLMRTAIIVLGSSSRFMVHHSVDMHHVYYDYGQLRRHHQYPFCFVPSFGNQCVVGKQHREKNNEKHVNPKPFHVSANRFNANSNDVDLVI